MAPRPPRSPRARAARSRSSSAPAAAGFILSMPSIGTGGRRMAWTRGAGRAAASIGASGSPHIPSRRASTRPAIWPSCASASRASRETRCEPFCGLRRWWGGRVSLPSASGSLAHLLRMRPVPSALTIGSQLKVGPHRGNGRPLTPKGSTSMRTYFRRHHGDPSSSDRTVMALRTALCVTVMTATVEQLEAAERTLVWLAENRPSAGAYCEALTELRLFAQIAEES